MSLWHLCSVTVPLSLFFITLTILRSTDPVFCGIALNLGLCDDLITRLGLGVSGKTIIEKSPPLHHPGHMAYLDSGEEPFPSILSGHMAYL
jgi:hypothetical protein